MLRRDEEQEQKAYLSAEVTSLKKNANSLGGENQALRQKVDQLGTELKARQLALDQRSAQLNAKEIETNQMIAETQRKAKESMEAAKRKIEELELQAKKLQIESEQTKKTNQMIEMLTSPPKTSLASYVWGGVKLLTAVAFVGAIGYYGNIKKNEFGLNTIQQHPNVLWESVLEDINTQSPKVAKILGRLTPSEKRIKQKSQLTYKISVPDTKSIQKISVSGSGYSKADYDKEIELSITMYPDSTPASVTFSGFKISQTISVTPQNSIGECNYLVKLTDNPEQKITCGQDAFLGNLIIQK